MEKSLAGVHENELVHSASDQRRNKNHLPDHIPSIKWAAPKDPVNNFIERFQKSGSKTFQNCHNFKYKRRKDSEIIDNCIDSNINPGNRNFFALNSNSQKRFGLYFRKNVCPTTCGKHVVNSLRLTLCQYVRSAKMLKICWLTWLMVITAIIMLGFAEITEAGVCWTARESNGKCTQRYSSNMSEEECCKHPNFAYTEREMSDVELFFAAAIDDGAVCKSCLDSCEAAKCGSGKRCVYRKGRPKCVCAPVCRSSKQKSRQISSSSKDPPSLKQPASPPMMLPKEQRPFPSFFSFGAMGESQTIDSEMPARNPINSKTSTSINATYKNSAVRWRRESQSHVAEALKLNQNETEHSTSKKRRKNQRKSKTASKRRKQSTTKVTTTSIPPSHSEGHVSAAEKFESNEQQGDSPKSGKIIIMAGSPEVDLNKTLKQHRKVSNSSSSQYSAMHHNRHQSKKEQQRHQSRLNRTSLAGGSRHEDNPNTAVLLGDKIRNGFFYHGFPYPASEDTTQQHVHGQFYNPVCGTDGKTYKTECQLKKRACRRESTTLTVAYRGHCQTSCKQVRCLNNLTCVEDQYGLPHCISCTITCPQDDASSVIDPTKAVCGADGLTYKSICDINRLICTTGRSIAVAYHGVCQAEANCNTIQCRDKQICLNDLLTNKPRCISCSFKCPRKRRPQGQRYHEHKICGTNNLTYHSWCQMRRESCNTGFYIDVKHVGACHKSSVPSKPKTTSS